MYKYIPQIYIKKNDRKSNTYARKENIFKYMYDSTSCVILTGTEEVFGKISCNFIRIPLVL